MNNRHIESDHLLNNFRCLVLWFKVSCFMVLTKPSFQTIWEVYLVYLKQLFPRALHVEYTKKVFKENKHL